MRTMTINIYKFNELSDKAKDVARQWWREASAGDDADFEFVLADADRVAGILGIDIKKRPIKLIGGGTKYDPSIWWEGFHSQGSGASFDGNYKYREDTVTKIREYAPTDEKLHQIADDLDDVGRRHPLLTASTVCDCGSEMSITLDDCPEASEQDELVVHEALIDFAAWIYKQLEEQSDYVNSDQYIDDHLVDAGYEFTANGKLAV